MIQLDEQVIRCVLQQVSVDSVAEQVRSLGYEGVQCSTEGRYPKTVVDAHIIMGILTGSYCHSVDVIALFSGDGD